MKIRWLFFGLIVMLAFGQGLAQYAPYYHLKGYIPATWVNPAIPLNNTVNINLTGVFAGLGTDGLAISDLSSKTESGSRYLDIKKINQIKNGNYSLNFENDIRTLDLGIKFGSLAFMAGHGFRSSVNMGYNSDLIKLLANGNGPYIGKTLEIGPSVNVTAYNELYLGAQAQISDLSLGVKAKLLYGVSSIYSESSKMQFTTLDEYYQLQFVNEYVIRSSNLLRYRALDDITINYSGFTFDNFFYNNRGLAVDVGIHYKINDQISISASALDIGKINWDFSPRKYESKGTFTFEGVDIINFIQDSTLRVQDTLLSLIEVTTASEKYSTSVNSRYLIGGSYEMDSWSFRVLYQLYCSEIQNQHQLSLSAFKSISFLDFGLLYTLQRNDLSNVGIYTGIKLKPIQLYVSANNIINLFSYEKATNTGVLAGLTLQF